MKPVILSLLIMPLLASAQNNPRFTGVITDSMCARGDHSRMRMGADDAECTIACNDAHGALYVLYDGSNTYVLGDQKTPEKFAGKRVTVTGQLDTRTNTIRVEAITAAE